MKLQAKDFNVGTEKSIIVSVEKNLDVTTAVNCINDIQIKEMLIATEKAVREANKLNPRNESIGKKQLELNKIDSIEDMELDKYTKRQAQNVIRQGKKAYSFQFLNVKEVVFACEMENSVSLYYKEYDLVPNGTTEDGEISFKDTSKNAFVTKLGTLNFDDKQFLEINEFDFKKSVTNDKDGSKALKIKELFSIQPELLEVNNIKTIEKNSKKELKASIEGLLDKIKSEISALDFFEKENN